MPFTIVLDTILGALFPRTIVGLVISEIVFTLRINPRPLTVAILEKIAARQLCYITETASKLVWEVFPVSRYDTLRWRLAFLFAVATF